MGTFLLVLMLAASPDCQNRKPALRTCAVDADCVAVHRQLDCCWSEAIEGINKSDAARFHAEEKACALKDQACKCEPDPTRLDDGQTATGQSVVEVACVKKVCTTRLKASR